MFELSDFYGYCREHDIDVIPYFGCPSPGVTIRDRGRYAIFLDIAAIRSARLLKGVCSHELGHAATGALHKVDSPYQLVAQSEYRANADSFGRYLNPQALRQAMRAGFREPWELAEYFDLEESCIRQALYYWTECRGIAI